MCGRIIIQTHQRGSAFSGSHFIEKFNTNDRLIDLRLWIIFSIYKFMQGFQKLKIPEGTLLLFVGT